MSEEPEGTVRVVQVLAVPHGAVARVVLEFEGIERKFVTAFVGKDNSFYLHPYRPPGDPWRVPDPSSTDRGDGHLHLHFPSFKPSGFDLNKISYHPSGYIHLTDQKGKRRRDGVRGPTFAAMTLPYDFAAIVPCRPSLLPEHRRGNDYDRGRAKRIEIVLPPDVRPFHVTFTIVDAATPPPAVPGPYFPHPVTLVFAAQRYGLAMTMWPVRSAEGDPRPDWPPFPFFIMRTAEGPPPGTEGAKGPKEDESPRA